MPKIKLKPHLNGIEIGLGSLFEFRVKPGEAVEVADDILEELLGFGFFDRDEERWSGEKRSADPNGADTNGEDSHDGDPESADPNGEA